MKRLLPLLWCFIGCVSAYDTYLTIHYAPCMRELELNPAGRWLLHLDGGSPALFMSLKWLGTLVALLTLILLRQSHPRMCQWATWIVAAFQGALLVILRW